MNAAQSAKLCSLKPGSGPKELIAKGKSGSMSGKSLKF
jgi:hypothetical protein